MYDTIVIGGGPGGAVCAAELAAQGGQVLLLERDEPGRHKPCAGGLPPRSMEIVSVPGELIERTIHEGLLVAPNLTEVRVSGKGQVGHIVFRARFDQFLRDRAAESGVTVHYQTKVQTIEITARQVAVTTEGPDGRQRFAARSLVGAFGMAPGTRLFEQLGVSRPPHLVTVMLELLLDESLVDQRIGGTVEMYVDSRITCGGCAWIFPKRAGAAVGIQSNRGASGTSYKRKLIEFIDHHPVAAPKLAGYAVPGGDWRTAVTGALIPTRALKKPYGDRFVLIGDAAGAADPLVGEGIWHAQRTGQIAARVLSRALAEDDLSGARLAEYDHWFKQEIVYPNTEIMRWVGRLLAENRYFDDVYNGLAELVQRDPYWQGLADDLFTAAFTGDRTLRRIAWDLARDPRVSYAGARALGWATLGFAPPLAREVFETIWPWVNERTRDRVRRYLPNWS